MTNAGKNKTKIFISVGIPVVLAIVILWLLLSGRVAIVWTGSGDPPVVTARVCGEDIIDQYNNSFVADSIEQRQEQLKIVGGKVADTANTSSDPNCQTILFNYYYDTAQYDKAKEHLDIAQKLADEGRYATTELEMTQSITAMKSLLEAVNAPEDAGRG